MTENPFIITEKVIPKYFCDRESESAELIKLLTNGNNVVLISPRRLGKTGLIQFCYEQKVIKQDYLTIYVDILSTTNLQEFTYLLGREVFDRVKNSGKGMWRVFLNVVKSLSGKIGFDPLSGLPMLNIQLGDISRPDYTLKEIFDYLDQAPKKCILAIDEFQQIRNYPEKNVEALIRSHILQINNCRLIFSGSEKHILSDMFLNSRRPFYQSASFIELRVIPSDIYIDFIRRMFKQHEKKISSDLSLKIYEMFEGVTFFIQRVCNGVFANTDNESEATEETLQWTIDGIMNSYDMIYRLNMSQLTTKQKELLIAIAKERSARKITSVDFIHKYSLSSASSIQTALKSLLKNNIVAKKDDYYFIEDIFLRLWIERNY